MLIFKAHTNKAHDRGKNALQLDNYGIFKTTHSEESIWLRQGNSLQVSSTCETWSFLLFHSLSLQKHKIIFLFYFSFHFLSSSTCFVVAEGIVINVILILWGVNSG